MIQDLRLSYGVLSWRCQDGEPSPFMCPVVFPYSDAYPGHDPLTFQPLEGVGFG
jgi:hypothetical protein